MTEAITMMTNESDLNPTQLTWTALLGQWMDFARASVAFPDDEEGQRCKDSVVPIINLQAVTFALANLYELPASERSLGLDRAEILIDKNVADLDAVWRSVPMSAMLLELILDSRKALQIAQLGTVIELVVPSPATDPNIQGALDPQGRFEMPDVEAELHAIVNAGFVGVIHLAMPGTLLLPEEPAGSIISPIQNDLVEMTTTENAQQDAAIAVFQFIRAVRPLRAVPSGQARQVYRLIDSETGQIVGDRVETMAGDPVAGRPLLVPAVANGEVILPSQTTSRWREQQMQTWPDDGQIRVEFT